MNQYVKERSRLFNEASTFCCCDSCSQFGCRESGLHITISLVDIIAMSSTAGLLPSDIFRKACKLGFDPVNRENPWVGRISLELKKPCLFLKGKRCGVYTGRPISCALFPEVLFVLNNGKAARDGQIFRKVPCLKTPIAISSDREKILRHLLRISCEELFLSDFFLFGVSPFLLDLKNISGEALGGVEIDRDGRAKLPNAKIEKLVEEKMRQSQLWNDWVEKIDKLDQTESICTLLAMKRWTDQILESPDVNSFARAHGFIR